MHPTIERMRGGLVVSCQANAPDVLYGPEAMAAMARAAELGGAVGIRANGPRDIAAIRKAVGLPIIGIYKQELPGYGIRITPTLEAAREVVEAGADLVALDGTRRGPAEGRLSAADLIHQVKETLNVPVMADVATLEEGIAAAEAGADIVASTLSGYTDYTPATKGPDFDLVRRLVKAVNVSVIAEGRISTPQEARRILDLGGFAVVVGSMITRPRWIVEHYVAAMRTIQVQPVVTVDIGGTKIAIGVSDSATHLDYHAEVPTLAREGGEAVLKRVQDAIAQAIQSAPEVKAIGISTSGEVDAAGRIMYSTGFMPGWMGIALREEIEARFKLPTAVENDGQAATLAEALYGAGQGASSVLGVTVGTGVGGGFVVDGRLYTGAHRAGLALGHVAVERNGRPCTCGKRGCLESYVSGPALVASYNERVADERKVDSGEDVMRAAQQNDAEAIVAINEIGDWLGYGLGITLNLLDPAVVVIGGGVAQLGERFLESVRAAVHRYAYPTVRETPVVVAQLGTQAGLIGAAALARQRLGDG